MPPQDYTGRYLAVPEVLQYPTPVRGTEKFANDNPAPYQLSDSPLGHKDFIPHAGSMLSTSSTSNIQKEAVYLDTLLVERKADEIIAALQEVKKKKKKLE